MLDFLNSIIPNVMSKPEALWEAIVQTLQMVGISGTIALVIGTFFGIVFVVTKQGGLMENRILYFILDKVCNFFRAVPFIILVFFLANVTRAIVGTTIQVKGAIFPLVIATIPYVARQIESAIAEIDSGLVEAAQSMGDSPIQIIFRVYLRESIPGMIRGMTITLITLIGYTAIAGAIGAGGLGSFALMYGYGKNQFDLTMVVVIIIFILITAIQSLGDYLIKKTEH